MKELHKHQNVKNAIVINEQKCKMMSLFLEEFDVTLTAI